VHTARLLIIGTVSALAVGLVAAPASAAPSDGTVVTFDILGGTLDIVSPADLSLTPITASAPGTDITAQMGVVAVTDSRAATDATWAATVTSTDFVTPGGLASQTIAAALVDYWSGVRLGGGTGNGTFTEAQTLAADAEALANAPTAPAVGLLAFSHTGGSGNNTASWNPTLNVNVPLTSAVGTYTGTVTHSVA